MLTKTQKKKASILVALPAVLQHPISASPTRNSDGCPVQQLVPVAGADAIGRAGTHYKQEHKDFIVQRRLQMQPKFDNKLHKNDQLWDDLMQEFFEKFPGLGHRTKSSIKDQFNVPQKSFRDSCKTKRTFANGQV